MNKSQETPLTMEGRLLLRPAEAFELLGLARSTGYDLLARGLLPSVRFGTRAVRVPVKALMSWIDQQTAKRDGDDD